MLSFFRASALCAALAITLGEFLLFAHDAGAEDPPHLRATPPPPPATSTDDDVPSAGTGKAAKPTHSPQPAPADATFHDAPASAKHEQNPRRGESAVAAGRKAYAEHCAACHGADARGSGNVPALVGKESNAEDASATARVAAQRASDGELYWFVTHGNPGNGMPAWSALGDDVRWDVVAYLRALDQGRASAAAAPTAKSRIAAPLPAPPFADFRTEAPGHARRITAADLPQPYATESASNGPHVVPRPDNAWPRAPTGFTVQRYATGLNGPRQIRSAPNGDVFVALTRAGKILRLRGVTPDGSAAETSEFAQGLAQPFGIAFYPPGPDPEWLYVGNTGDVLRMPYRNGDRAARGTAQHIADLPGGGHSTRDLVFSPDGKTLYVAVGSRSNVDDPDTTPAEKNRADILAFAPDGSAQRVYASGIRNPVGLAIQPGSGTLWCSVNERDGLGDNLVPDYITHVEQGAFYGWPWWYIGAHQDPRHPGKHPELKDSTRVPDVLLQPHSASLGLTFYEGTQFPAEYHGDVFAAEHGSWNKAVRAGYEVVRVPLHQSSRSDGSYEDFLTGFVLDDGDVWGRPVGVAVAPDGALLVTDDASGTIWRVSYSGAPAAK